MYFETLVLICSPMNHSLQGDLFAYTLVTWGYFQAFLIFVNSMGVKCASVQLFCIFSLPVSMSFFSFFLCDPHIYVLCHFSLNFWSFVFLYLRPLWILCKMSPFVINVAVIFFPGCLLTFLMAFLSHRVFYIGKSVHPLFYSSKFCIMLSRAILIPRLFF